VNKVGDKGGKQIEVLITAGAVSGVVTVAD